MRKPITLSYLPKVLPCLLFVGFLAGPSDAFAQGNTDEDFVTFALDVDYGGAKVSARSVGDYELANTIYDDGISSLTVPAGLRVELYTGPNATGSRLIVTEDTPWIGAEFNDVVSSIKIRNVGDKDDRQLFRRRIEAEDFTYSNNVIVETTTDDGGGKNVGGVQRGSWMSYSNITIPRTGTYFVYYRIASIAPLTQLNLELDGGSVLLGDIRIGSTGGWQDYESYGHRIQFSAGTYSIGITAPTDSGWNLNWFEIVEVDTESSASGLAARTDPEGTLELTPLGDGPQVALFPNPASSALNVTGLGEGATVSVVDAVGKVVVAEAPAQSAGTTELDVRRLPAGVYHLRVGGASPQVHKFVKQ